MIDHKAIEQRLAQLRQGRDQLLAQLNAHAGAIDDCEHWLRMLDEESARQSETKTRGLAESTPPQVPQ
jgi:hypothetical protein